MFGQKRSQFDGARVMGFEGVVVHAPSSGNHIAREKMGSPDAYKKNCMRILQPRAVPQRDLRSGGVTVGL